MADRFHWVDYLLFLLTIVVSLGIGLIFAWKNRHRHDTEEYLMGSRQLQLIPVAISILVSLTTSFGILGTPAETYAYGTQFTMHVVSASMGCLLGAFLFVPIFYPLRVVSAFEYLEARFESPIPRIFGTINSLINNVFVMGLSLYAPSNALNAVTGFRVWLSILLTIAVTTIYTLVGGMKAVIWTDVFQSVVIVVGLFVVVALGVADLGGFNNVWDINDQWKRLQFFDMNPDPRAGSTFWSVVVAMTFLWMSVIATQPTVQRYCALPTMRQAKMSVLLNIPGFIIVGLLTSFCGSVAFAYYADVVGCDPLAANPELGQDINKVFPLYVSDVIGHPGLPGIFIACLYAGSLSTISSLLNCSAAVFWEDLMKPFFYDWTEKRKTDLTKVIVLVFAIFSIGFAFAVQEMEGSFVGITYTVVGTTLGPVVGLMIAGALIPRASNIMCLVGALLGFGWTLWMAVGLNQYELHPSPKPFPIHNCDFSPFKNSTVDKVVIGELLTPKRPPLDGLENMYAVSFLYYPIISIVIVIIFALISFLIPRLRMDPTPVNLLFPFVRFIFRRCGAQHITEEESVTSHSRPGTATISGINQNGIPMNSHNQNGITMNPPHQNGTSMNTPYHNGHLSTPVSGPVTVVGTNGMNSDQPTDKDFPPYDPPPYNGEEVPYKSSVMHTNSPTTPEPNNTGNHVTRIDVNSYQNHAMSTISN